MVRRPTAHTSHRLLLPAALIATLWIAIYPGGPSLRGEDMAQAPLVREIFVPFEHLNVLLESHIERIFLSREEYLALLARARKSPLPETAPIAVTMLSAEYVGTIDDGRMQIKGTLSIDVLQEGIHMLPLELSGLGLRRALLDDRGAAIGVGDQRQPALFVEGVGKHELVLDLVAPLETSSALQSLNFQIPVPAATILRLAVPGNVEVKSGADVMRREIDSAANVTRFELLPRRGMNQLVMTLNNRQLLTERAIVARSVIVDEVTQGYERLHAKVSMGVLHGAVDRFRFVLPREFEVTDVSAAQLSRWIVEDEQSLAGSPRRILDIALREPTVDTVVLDISATRTARQFEDWKFPRLEALDVAGQVAVLGLLVEDRLKTESLTPSGLVPINTSVLTDALPESLFRAEPGAPQVRPIVAYYAPQADFDLRARFVRPPGRLRVTSNLVLLLDETQQRLRGAFVLQPEVETVFAIDVAVPAGWHITEVTGSGGESLPFETAASAAGGTRIRVRLPEGVRPNSTASVSFKAHSTPGGWLGDWTQRPTTFPAFTVFDAARDEGAIAVRALNDLTVRPDTLQQLVPLDQNDKAKFGLEGVQTDLAYLVEAQPYSATFVVERTAPMISARTMSFVRVETENLVAHYEVVYEIQQARSDRLALQLPADTPDALSIRGLDDVTVREFHSQVIDGQRQWEVRLADKHSGRVRLAVDFQQRLDLAEPKDLVLPLVRASDVAYQSGFVAVEGSPELDVLVTTDNAGAGSPRKIDVGELAEADYAVGRRVLAAVGFVGDNPTVKIDVFRRSGFRLPPAIVQRAELITLTGANGATATAARYQLRTHSQYLEIILPTGADLWSASLDGTSLAPQREQDRLLLGLPAKGTEALRDLQIVYGQIIPPAGLVGHVEAEAPRLMLRDDEGTTSREVPVADMRWYLQLPSGYRVIRSNGTMQPDLDHQTTLVQLGPRRSGWTQLANTLLCDRLPPRGRLAERFSTSKPDRVSGQQSGAGEIKDRFGQTMDKGLAGEMGGPSVPLDRLDLDTVREGRSRGVTESEGLDPEEASTINEALARPARDGSSDAIHGGTRFDGSPPPTSGVMTKDRDPAQDSLRDRTYWALEGVRSLPISFAQYLEQPSEDLIAFESLGVEPVLQATLINRRPLAALAWGVALLIALLGVQRARRPFAVKARFLFTVLVLTTLLPLLAPWDHALGTICDMALWTACGLVPFYLLVSIADRFAGVVHRRQTATLSNTAATAVSTMLIMFCVPAPACHGQSVELDDMQLVIPLNRYLKPVKIPDDAIVIPYHADDDQGVQKAERILVPYDKYAELWKMAYPDKQPLARPAPAPYALAGAKFHGRLAGDEFLTLSGQIQFEVYTDDVIDIPLALTGGVLVEAKLDGQPARLRVAQAQQEPPIESTSTTSHDAEMIADTPCEDLLLVNVAGKGRKTLALTVRLRLERRGGWRIAAGRLPAAQATLLTLEMPEPRTEVRLTRVTDRARFESTLQDERIETALQPDHAFSIQWRPKVAEGEVDKSLTADSHAELEIRDDGVRLAWQVSLSFPRSRRESLTLTAPSEYQVERVTGANVRGWQATSDGARQTIEVSLLKAVTDQEKLTVHLARRGRVGQADLATFPLPAVSVAGSLLHQGTLVLRRSPLLEVRTDELKGLVRTDLPERSAASEVDPTEQGVLVSRSFQAYRFQSIDYAGTLSVAQLSERATARVQSVLRIADRESRLETLIVLRPTDRPLHRVRVQLPANLQVERVTAPGNYDWSVTAAAGQSVLTVYLGDGQSGEFKVLIAGTLGRRQSLDPLPLPVWNVLDVTRQEGDIVVQTDPAIDIRAEGLHQCENVLLSQMYGWLRPEQRSTARLALHYRAPDYSATLALEARQPRVTCNTVTNIRVTGRAIEETVLLDFNILNAGIREIVFQLPFWMKDARIKSPMLRQKTIESVGQHSEASDDGRMVRVRIQLQDEVMGPFRVLVENDRLLTKQTQVAPIPVIETGRTGQRLVSLESSGQGEVVFDDHLHVEPITRQQQPWRRLAELFGDNILAAYLVQDQPADETPRLSYHTKDHAAVETVGARIGFAETVLTLDAVCAYRAQQIYRVDNSTEQFLVIELPQGAQLWTARVAGEAVKPTAVPGNAGPNQVRIPLVKTAPGDADYEVALIYAGKMPPLVAISTLQFPLVKTVNVNVELSQVRLYVPENYRWFNFGGTMGLVSDEAEYQMGYAVYLTKQIQQVSRLLQSDPDVLTRLRCANNLKQLDAAYQNFQATNATLNYDSRFSTSGAANFAALKEAEELLMRQTENDRSKVIAGADNRNRLGQLVEGQQIGRSKNIVNRMDSNFLAVAPPENTPRPVADKEAVNSQWFAANQLQQSSASDQKRKVAEGRILLGERHSGRQPVNAAGKPTAQERSDFNLANVELKKQLEGVGEKRQELASRELERSEDEAGSVSRRYELQLEQQSAQFGQGRGSQGSMSQAKIALPAFADALASQVSREGSVGGEMAAAASTPTGYLASLNVDLPRRGTVYFFKTPRGEVTITARAIDQSLVSRLWKLTLATSLALGLLLVGRRLGK